MNKNGPIIIIEDDEDDQQFLKNVFTKLAYPNEVIFFSDGLEALAYLMKPSVIPFLILSDINMPKLDGLELRRKLKNDADLAIKCIPYLFFTTTGNQRAVIDAYSASAQGFFIKQYTMEKIEETISTIMKYWKMCETPNHSAAPDNNILL